MSSFLMLAVFAVTAFLVAWVVNALVGLMMGERPRDTGSLWLDIFLRLFAVLELGAIARILSYLGFTGWPRKAVLFIGALCVLLFLVRAYSGSRSRNYLSHTYTYTNGQLYEIPN